MALALLPGLPEGEGEPLEPPEEEAEEQPEALTVEEAEREGDTELELQREALELREADTVPLTLLTGLLDWEGEALKDRLEEALGEPVVLREEDLD